VNSLLDISNLPFVVQTLYLISLLPFYSAYFSNWLNQGLVLSGKFANLLSTRNVHFIFWIWLISSTISFFPSKNHYSLVNLLFSAISLFFSRYFFVYLRYQSVGRGNGAPGFMIYWYALYGFFFKVFHFLNWNIDILLILLVIDFSLIMTSSATYKFLNGYLANRGIEYGLVNPMWSRFSKFFINLIESHYKLSFNIFFSLNLVAILCEYLIAFFILIPNFRDVGALLLVMMFILLLPIKLGTLPLTMFAISYSISDIKLESMNLFNYSPWEFLFFITSISVLCLSYLWVWTFNLELSLNHVVRSFAYKSYIFTGVIIWSVFTWGITKHYIRIAENTDKNGASGTQLFGRDRGVHAGITRATLMTFLERYPKLKTKQRERIRIYLDSKVFRSNETKDFEIFTINIDKNGVSFLKREIN